PPDVEASRLRRAHAWRGGREARIARLLLPGRGGGVPHLPVRVSGKGDAPGRALVPFRPVPQKKPPAASDRGLVFSGPGISSLGRQDLEHPRAANRAHTLQGGPAVGHLHLLRIRDLPLRLALHAVAFIRGHRSFSNLRHFAPPFGGGRGRGQARWAPGSSDGRLPPPPASGPHPARTVTT